MQTPVSKKIADPASLAANSRAVKPLPALAAVYITRSRFAIYLYRCGYGAFALSLLSVFFPFIVEHPFWLLGLLVGWVGLWWGYRQQISTCITGELRFSDGFWWFTQEGHSCPLSLAAEVLCWSWLIILPLRDNASGKMRRMVIVSDALSKSDNARLRRWLRACLIPSA